MSAQFDGYNVNNVAAATVSTWIDGTNYLDEASCWDVGGFKKCSDGWSWSKLSAGTYDFYVVLYGYNYIGQRFVLDDSMITVTVQ